MKDRTVRGDEESKKFVQELIELFKKITDLANPLSWASNAPSEKLDTYAAVVFGECGAGKSTSLNNLMGFYCQHFGLKYEPETMTFDARKSPSSVTKCCTTKVVGGQTLVDTPGINDPDKNLDDATIQ